MSTTHPVKISIRALGHVVVEYDVDPLNVHASSKQVSGHEDTLAEALESLVLGQPGQPRRKRSEHEHC